MPTTIAPEHGRSFFGGARELEAGTDALTAMKKAGLLYKVVQKPVYDEQGRELPGYVRNIRELRGDDPDPVFGIVTPRYKPIQNEDAFTVCDYVAQESEAEFVAGGITDHADLPWLLMRVGERLEFAGDVVDPFLLFLNSHRGDRSFTIAMLPTRIECTNALTYSVLNSQHRINIRHVGDVAEKVKAAQVALASQRQYLEEMEALARTLAAKPVSSSTLSGWLDKLYPISESMSDRKVENTQEMREQIRWMMREAPNLANHHGTAWAFVQAVTEVADWGTTRERDTMARLCWDSDTRIKSKALAIAARLN